MVLQTAFRGYKMHKPKIKTIFLPRDAEITAKKTVFNLMIVYHFIRRKLNMIRC